MLKIRTLHTGFSQWMTWHRRASNSARSTQSDDWEKKEEQLGPLRHTLDGSGFSAGMRHVTTRTYDIACNWKVFADNYLVCKRA